MNMTDRKKIIGVADVPCAVCDAKAHEICIAIPGETCWLNIWHAERVFDANDATRALNVLLGHDE